MQKSFLQLSLRSHDYDRVIRGPKINSYKKAHVRREDGRRSESLMGLPARRPGSHIHTSIREAFYRPIRIGIDNQAFRVCEGRERKGLRGG